MVNNSNLIDILFVTDQFPFPPRNGVTLPTYHYLVSLKDKYRVLLCLFYDKSEGIDVEILKKNEQLFGKIVLIPVIRRTKKQRLWNELSRRELFYHGWLAIDKLDEFFYANIAVIVSPMSAVGKWHSTGLVNNVSSVRKIAAINDCTTAEFRLRKMHIGGGFFFKVKGWLDWIRSFGVAKIEQKYLKNFENILLQTEADQNFMKQMVSPNISSKVEIIANGVNPKLFCLNLNRKKEVLFVAELSKEYDLIAKWLVNEVWPEVQKVLISYKLVIIGKGASEELKELMVQNKSIEYIEFVDDLGLLYAEASIVISPIFKGFGLINKTLEAMASGIPVVGGFEAFNGIKFIEHNENAFVCQSAKTVCFVEAIILLGLDKYMREKIGKKGQSLIKGQFSWSKSTDKLQMLFSDEI